jgi:hypothetical protein
VRGFIWAREEGECETVSKADKIAVSRGFRGAVSIPVGGGRETGIGEGMAAAATWMGGVSRLRWARGGSAAVGSPYS